MASLKLPYTSLFQIGDDIFPIYHKINSWKRSKNWYIKKEFSKNQDTSHHHISRNWRANRAIKIAVTNCDKININLYWNTMNFKQYKSNLWIFNLQTHFFSFEIGNLFMWSSKFADTFTFSFFSNLIKPCSFKKICVGNGRRKKKFVKLTPKFLFLLPSCYYCSPIQFLSMTDWQKGIVFV